MWVHHGVLPHPWRRLGWANHIILQHKHWPELLPDSILRWATPDKGRLSNAPRSNATKTMTGPTASRSAIATDIPSLSYAIIDHNEAPRSDCARHTRSRTATLTGNTPLRPDYRMADRSGFAASAAPSPPPKPTLRSSPLPRSARLASRSH